MAHFLSATAAAGAAEECLEVLPWLAQHFPDQPQPSPNMLDAPLARLLAAVKGRRMAWELEMRKLRMVELFLARYLHRASAEHLIVHGIRVPVWFDVVPWVSSS